MLSLLSPEDQLARRLGAHGRHAIASFPDGAVGRIVGQAGYSADDELIAPLSGRACAAWFVRVSGATPPSTDNSPVLEACNASMFVVTDGTGCATIVPDGSSLLLACDLTETLGFSRRPPPQLTRFLREHRRRGH